MKQIEGIYVKFHSCKYNQTHPERPNLYEHEDIYTRSEAIL